MQFQIYIYYLAFNNSTSISNMIFFFNVSQTSYRILKAFVGLQFYYRRNNNKLKCNFNSKLRYKKNIICRIKNIFINSFCK